MNEEKIDYKNWVPKKLIYAFFIAESIVLILAIIPIHVIFNIIFWIITGIVTFFGFLCIYAYYKFGKNDNELQREVHDILLNNLPWTGQGEALDIGTGNGGVLIKLAMKYPDSKVVGIDSWGKGWDYSKEDCEKNAKIMGISERVDFQKASATDLPFEDEKFDAVVSNFVFHEVRGVKSTRDLIFEALRVLKKGGAFSFQDYFITEMYYGKKEELIEALQTYGLKEFHLKDLNESMEVPLLLRLKLFLGNIVTLYGIK